MQSHFPWTALPKCGLCALWNGWVNGGSPTLADVYGAVAHPLAIGSVISFGLVNGAKFMLLASLILAGFAQWWLAKVMRLSWLPRLWVAGMAVVGGHIAGRLQLGLVIFVFSTASISSAVSSSHSISADRQSSCRNCVGRVDRTSLFWRDKVIYRSRSSLLGFQPCWCLQFLLRCRVFLGRSLCWRV